MRGTILVSSPLQQGDPELESNIPKARISRGRKRIFSRGLLPLTTNNTSSISFTSQYFRNFVTSWTNFGQVSWQLTNHNRNGQRCATQHPHATQHPSAVLRNTTSTNCPFVPKVTFAFRCTYNNSSRRNDWKLWNAQRTKFDLFCSWKVISIILWTIWRWGASRAWHASGWCHFWARRPRKSVGYLCRSRGSRRTADRSATCWPAATSFFSATGQLCPTNPWDNAIGRAKCTVGRSCTVVWAKV